MHKRRKGGDSPFGQSDRLANALTYTVPPSRCSFTCRRHVVTSHLITTGPSVYGNDALSPRDKYRLARSPKSLAKFHFRYSIPIRRATIAQGLVIVIPRYISLRCVERKKQLIIAVAINFLNSLLRILESRLTLVTHSTLFNCDCRTDSQDRHVEKGPINRSLLYSALYLGWHWHLCIRIDGSIRG